MSSSTSRRVPRALTCARGCWRSVPRMDHIAVDGRILDDRSDVLAHPLIHGSRIEFGNAHPNSEPADGPHLVVISGPEAGAWYPLPVGRPIRVGRSDGEVRLSRDLLLSRLHVQFEFDGQQVMVTDLGSSNGTSIEGERLGDPVAIEPNTFVHVGSSILAVVSIEARDHATLGAPSNGSYPFPRTFRGAMAPLQAEHRLPRAPTDTGGGGGSTWWRALLPLVSGIGFTVVMGNFLFLFIAALAPLVYAGDAYRQKKKRAKLGAADIEAYERELAAAPRPSSALPTKSADDVETQTRLAERPTSLRRSGTDGSGSADRATKTSSA